ncbi:NAD(P)-dependent oxidoreductase [Sphingobacterium bovistauri]|uniref:SDR family oxidoreductase n=1 Tax=Sphingobacterium bovistauri TaxID=2781959 RepID=A0ABS7ZBQ1_9SPHI|nr:SDR family oxidoreductase [Sphingobacterium bovistauri]MCA5006354.1 SDR family oxidoreductase [Sphingobacterium bovistauri]
MKIAIFGATGKTGIELVKEALAHGHDVSVMVRDPKRLPTFSKEITVFTGDFTNLDVVKSTVQGQDAVICTLGSRELYKNSGLRTFGTRLIIEAMQEAGVQRLVVMSSMGIGESWNKLFMPAARADHEAQESAVKSSSLDWTIIRPSGLTDVPSVSTYEFGKDISPKTSRISRANVADLMLKVIESNSHVHKAITITN